jgi:hypothetical protein
MHCKEDSNYVFPEIKLRGLVPSFHIHTSLSDLYMPRIGPPILLQPNRQTDRGNIQYKSLTDIQYECKIGNEAEKFHFQFSVQYRCSVNGLANILYSNVQTMRADRRGDGTQENVIKGTVSGDFLLRAFFMISP